MKRKERQWKDCAVRDSFNEGHDRSLVSLFGLELKVSIPAWYR